jgi:hypothetical protein
MDVWGFPKSLGAIDVHVTERSASFSVREANVPVLRGSYRRPLPWSMPVSNPWGAALDDVSFTPVLWHTMTEIESVFLAPTARQLD